MLKIKNAWLAKAAIVIGVLIIPLMYTYFYLGAFWDPYARLTEVPVAVVNLDAGAEINGKARNLGNEVCDSLKEDASVKFIFTDKDDAEQGVLGDAYYASITIPQDFSYNASTASQDTEKLHSSIVYAANQKKNYLAAQILENALSTIKQTVNAKIDKEIISSLNEKLEGVPDSLGELQDGLGQLSDGSSALYDGTKDMENGVGALLDGSLRLLDGAKQVASGSNDLTTGAAALKDGTQALNDSMPALSSGVGDLDSGAAQLNEGLSTLASNNATLTDNATQLSNGAFALQSGLADYTAGVSSAYDGAALLESGVQNYTAAVSSASEGATNLASGAGQLSQGVHDFSEGYTSAYDALIAYRDTGDAQYLSAALNGFEQLSQSVSTLDTSTAYISEKVTELSDGLVQINDTSAQLTTGALDLKNGLDALQTNNASLESGIAAVADGATAFNKGITAYTDGVQSAAEGSGVLSAGLNALNAQVPALSEGVNALDAGAGELASGAKRLSDGAGSVSDGAQTLSDGTSTLQTGTYALNDGAMRLNDGIDTAKQGVDESVKDAHEQLQVLDGLVDYAEEPVSTETVFIQPVENYGSAFAPYFMGLSLWVGGLMVYFGIYLDYNRKIASLTKGSRRVVLRTVLFGFISAIQGVLLAFVIKDVLHIAVNNPLMLFASSILVSLTFMAIIQFCIINLGDAGKFISLLLLILQLTSCAGTFPIETQSAFYRIINKVLPMTYSTQLFKEAISGTPGANATHSAIVLGVFLVAFAILTLFLSRGKLKDDFETIMKKIKSTRTKAKATV